MNKWFLQKAAEFCASVRDGTHDSPKSVEGGGKPLVTSKVVKQGVVRVEDAYLISEKDYRKINERSKVDRWDILMTMIGTVGECAIVKDDPDYAIKNIALFKMSGDEEKAKWLYYYLTSPMGQGALRGNFRGSSQQYISLDQLRNLEIPVPEKNVRSQIVAILSDYDSAIDNARRQIALLEEAAMRLYREWFVVKANPKWEKKTFGTFAKVARGRVITKATAHRGEVPVVAAGLSPAYFTEKANVKAPSVTISASGANAGYVWYHANDIWASDCSYLSKNETPYVYFSYAFLKTHSAVLKGLQKGSAQPHVHGSDIEGISFFVPGDDLLRQYEMTVDPVFQKIGVNEKLITSLTEARDRLLPKLMSGEIEV